MVKVHGKFVLFICATLPRGLGREREPRQDRSLERADLAQLAQTMQQPRLHPRRLHLSLRATRQFRLRPL